MPRNRVREEKEVNMSVQMDTMAMNMRKEREVGRKDSKI